MIYRAKNRKLAAPACRDQRLLKCWNSEIMGRKRRKAEFVQIGSILGDVLKKYRRETDVELVQVWQVWDNIVGEVIAQNTKPAAFKGPILLVHVTNSTWIHQLQFLKKEMIQRLNTALGKPLIEDLKFRIGPLENEK